MVAVDSPAAVVGTELVFAAIVQVSVSAVGTGSVLDVRSDGTGVVDFAQLVPSAVQRAAEAVEVALLDRKAVYSGFPARKNSDPQPASCK